VRAEPRLPELLEPEEDEDPEAEPLAVRPAALATGPPPAPTWIEGTPEPDGVDTCGTDGTETCGTETCGTDGTLTCGTDGTETCGTETCGTETDGASAAVE
jgi:hypothetical protein